MRLHRWRDIKEKKLSSAKRAEADRWVKATVLEMDLKELRAHRGKTQAELASLIEMTQGEVSRTERRDDHLVSTLRSIVEGLGGKLEVSAVFDGEKVILNV